MTTLDLPEQLEALESVRAELEAALGSDENWRALRAGGPADTDAGLDLRNARLAKALEANPLYLAWRHLGEAIRALREADHATTAALTHDDLTRIHGITPALAALLAENGVTRCARIATWTSEDIDIATEVLGLSAGTIERQGWVRQATLIAARQSQLSADALFAQAVDQTGPAPWPEEEELGPMPDSADAAMADGEDIELPDDIRERIRADAADAPREEPSEVGAEPDLPPEADAEPEVTTVDEPTGKSLPASRLAAIPSLEPITAPEHQQFADRLHKLETDMDDLDEAIAPSANQVDDEPAPEIEPEPMPEPAVEVPAAVASATGAEDNKESGSDLPPMRPMAEPVEAKVTFIARKASPGEAPDTGAGNAGQSANLGGGFVPLAAAAEEADVVIVKPEAPETAPVRRFLKALSGD